MQSDGSIRYWGGNGPFNNAGTFVKSGGTGETKFNDIIFNNSGSVEARAGTLTFGMTYTQTAGRTLLNGGSISGNPLQIQGGSVEGNGVIYTSVSNGGTMSPGLSPGLVDVQANYTQLATGTFQVEIAGLAAGTQYDQLHVFGGVSLAGTLNVQVMGEILVNDAFTILVNDGTDGISGTFNGLAEGATVTASSGHQFRVSYLGTDGLGNDVVLVCTYVPPDVIDVSVNIQPESFNLDSNGTLTVVIYSSADFSASQINVGTVLFAGAHAWQSTLVDVNQDGRLDLQLKFRRQETYLDAVYSQMLLDDFNSDSVLNTTRQTAFLDVTGQLVDNAAFQGSDSLILFKSGNSLRDLLSRLFGGT